ncbi:MAG: hypothetical protein E3J43_09975 [Candidatus Heimdallarchaeota archaeon]|nr:MAG: hypothetical protein E3J43_09975 [Candidatus Heimdallarchaeota archaeon]
MEFKILKVEKSSKKNLGGWVVIAVDIQGNSSVLDADKTIYGENNLSDYDFFLEEANNIGMQDVFGETKLSIGVYKIPFKINGSWDYEHVEYDYDILLDLENLEKITLNYTKD